MMEDNNFEGMLQVLLPILRNHISFQSLLVKRLMSAHLDCYRQRTRSRKQVLLRMMARSRSSVSWTQPTSQHWWESVVPDFSPRQFEKTFRMSQETFEYICTQVKHVMEKKNTNYRLCVPVQKRVAIAVWKLATGDEYRTISRLFGVGLSTVFNCVQDFCKAVTRVLRPVHMRFPDAEKLVEMASLFQDRWGVPQCVSAIDSHHLPIMPPKEYPQDYRNNKGWHSVILQAVVDGNGRFWNAMVGAAGRMSDARVLRQSYVWDTLRDTEALSKHKEIISGCEVGPYMIGDSAYPLQKWIMKPFTQSADLTPEQCTFNHRLSCASSVVETSFRRLKGRWRCLLKRNNCTLELVNNMAVTCCVLHNICEERGDICSVEHQDRHLNVQPRAQVLRERADPEGAEVRGALMDYFNLL
ncbi:protein ANTAGONIST OF LIKE HETEROCHROMATIN PROTEIN 1 [Notolabrus celidotus]|uniref:protein ANTAGONIST OF LIKE HETEROCHROMATIN PROTEIN 1 n=1 Tax=Notolabrus celidotus TaxID=1203425 RepID=UPI00148FDDFB|nr:protein ANTAGONIST OF LIKE HETEROCHROMATIN PROTEIN 1 [Notolabrus celidotus]